MGLPWPATPDGEPSGYRGLAPAEAGLPLAANLWLLQAANLYSATAGGPNDRLRPARDKVTTCGCTLARATPDGEPRQGRMVNLGKAGW